MEEAKSQPIRQPHIKEFLFGVQRRIWRVTTFQPPLRILSIWLANMGYAYV